MSSTSDDTILPPTRRPINSGGLDGDTVLPNQNSAGIHAPGDVIDNRYTVIREIGRGGMGVVYEVEDAVTARRYAIKRLLPDSLSNEHIVRAFVREGTAAEQFSTSSPHFVTTKTVGKDSCGFYVLMELVNLPTLRQVLRASGRLELNRAVAILNSLAMGLADLHKANLIHRDLKPENIFVDESEHATAIRLVDFGLTREVTANSTIGMSGGGSLKYMAPEQFRDEPATVASDVYAFGVIAYEMLTGELPTYGESLTDYVPDSPEQLVSVITGCLAGKVERRIDNAITLSKEIVGIGGHGLDASTPSSIVYEGTLILSGIPDGASVKLDGVAVSGSVHKLTLINESQSIDLLVQCAGYEDYHCKVMMTSGMVTKHHVVARRLLTKPKRRKSDFPHLDRYVHNMCQVPGGTFHMGSNMYEDEQPIHMVTLHGFWLGETPVTVAMWKEYCLAAGISLPDAPSWGWIDDHPVVNVSWNDIMGTNGHGGFCAWASAEAGLHLTLPTEAQFEYASCGGQSGLNYPWGDTFSDSNLWCSVTTQLVRTAPVVRTSNTFRNAFGLTDMSGNVWQWCSDFYAPYVSASETYLTSPPATSFSTRCVRGGSWFIGSPVVFRCAYRLRDFPGRRINSYGFRLSAGPG